MTPPGGYRNLEPRRTVRPEHHRSAAASALWIVLIVVAVALVIGGLAILAFFVAFGIGMNNYGSNK